MKRGEDFQLELVEREEAEAGGARATLSAHAPEDLCWVRGHFPGAPIVPGVAQLIPLVERSARLSWPALGPVRGLRRLKFSAPIRPGESLEVDLSLKGSEGAPAEVGFTLRRGEERVSRGTLLFG